MALQGITDYARYASGSMSPDEWLRYAPENFLQHSILRIGIADVRSAVIQASLDDSSANWAVTRRSTVLGREKADGGVFDLLGPGGGRPAFAINWCGYKDQAFQGHMLQHPPNLMFTATMTGCTFAIGTANPQGDRLVGHFNIQDQGGTNVPEMAFAARSVFGDQVTLFDKTQYMVSYGASGSVSPLGTTVQTTTVGFYENNAWRFFRQRYRQTGGGSFEIMDVLPVA